MNLTHVYLVVPEGVSAKNAAAVCTARFRAEKIAEDLWKKSDGYHSFRIECRRLDTVYNTFPLGGYLGREPTTRPPEIEHVTEREMREEGYDR